LRTARAANPRLRVVLLDFHAAKRDGLLRGGGVPTGRLDLEEAATPLGLGACACKTLPRLKGSTGAAASARVAVDKGFWE
jgi:hypothetical protein